MDTNTWDTINHQQAQRKKKIKSNNLTLWIFKNQDKYA